MKFDFASNNFEPEFVSFRLRHAEHDNLSEPIVAEYDNN